MSRVFGKNGGGGDGGFRGAGAEAFKGGFGRHPAREPVRYGSDARFDPGKPVRAKFGLLSPERRRNRGLARRRIRPRSRNGA